ncbi:hypothetical protein LC612_40170, partial [Nostoc sp. CHAB 5834]|nr:hypothetical protein [Nostoc sp. CHAB 5834]
MDKTTQLAPIVLFAYRRPDEFQRTLAALQANHLASDSELYVYVDGPRHPFDLPKVNEVRQIVDGITGFRAVYSHYAERNWGLANSIIKGVSNVVKQHGRAIVLEDDLLTSRNFLDYMNQALDHYQDQPAVFSLAGYTFPFKQPTDYKADGYLYPRTGSWGWATWADRWQTADWHLADYDVFLADKKRIHQFNFYGSDRLRMLRRWKDGEVDSWAIRWCYAQAKVNGLTLFPTRSKIENIGFSLNSTHTNGYNRFKTQ